MNELDGYLGVEIVRSRRALFLTAVCCFLIVAGVLVAARRAVGQAGRRLSPEAIVNQVGGIADRELASREGENNEHLRTWIPDMMGSGAQSAIDGVDLYRRNLENRIGRALKPADSDAIGRAVNTYLATGKVAPGLNFGIRIDAEAKKRLDAIFAPISMTRDRLEKLASNGKDLLPFERLTRRSIAVLLRGYR